MREILSQKVAQSIHDRSRTLGSRNRLLPILIETMLERVCGDVALGGKRDCNLAETAILNPLARIIFSLLMRRILTCPAKRLQSRRSLRTETRHRFDLAYESSECIRYGRLRLPDRRTRTRQAFGVLGSRAVTEMSRLHGR